jgi:protein-S-isoprenylcysteine O-methyltransferase Ste14
MSDTQTPSRPDHPGVIAPPPLIYLGVLLLAFAVDWVVAGPGLGLPVGLRMVAATVLLIAGLALPLAGGARFKASKTNIHPWKPATSVVRSGVYGYTRNPMYLGMAVIYAALSLFGNSLIALAGLPLALAIMHYGVIAREERYLESKFGAEYRAYKSAVRRWL